MYKNIVLFILLPLLLMTVPIQAIEVIFRYDDLKLTPSEIDKRVVALFGEKNVPLSIAVIPCNSSEMPIPAADSALLSALRGGGYEVALHGLTHCNSEFGALEKEETFRRIHKGKCILQEATGKRINTFIPPFNAVNPFVPEALLRDSMHILSADMFDYIDGAIDYFPETLGHLIKQWGVWSAAQNTLFSCKEKDAICVVMFHSYDLQTDADWAQLTDLLTYCQTNNDIHLHTFSSLAESGVHSSGLRYRVNQWESGVQKYMLPHGVLHNTLLCVAVHCLNALLYALLALPFGALSIAYGKRRIDKIKVTRKCRRFISLTFFCSAICGFVLAWCHLLGPLKLVALELCVNGILCACAIACQLYAQRNGNTTTKS